MYAYNTLNWKRHVRTDVWTKGVSIDLHKITKRTAGIMSVKDIIKALKENDYDFVDLRFCDTRGKEQHVSIPISQVDEDFFEEGKMFDGSSIAGGAPLPGQP